jgi:spore coat protein U-like protein
MMRTASVTFVLTALILAAPAQAAYTCSVTTGGSLNFLVYDPFATPATASSDVTIACRHLGGGNEFISWAMTLSNGSSGTCTARQMQRQASPAAILNYNVFQGATSSVWGNLSCASFPSGTLQVNNGNPNASDFRTMRGVLPNGQDVPAGTYLDSLVLTVTF